jgi:hypothetical protein
LFSSVLLLSGCSNVRFVDFRDGQRDRGSGRGVQAVAGAVGQAV